MIVKKHSSFSWKNIFVRQDLLANGYTFKCVHVYTYGWVGIGFILCVCLGYKHKSLLQFKARNTHTHSHNQTNIKYLPKRF